MTPEEWPSAAEAAKRNPPARRSGSRRLATVRADFFLNAAERLTEQERALMTAMVHGLVSDTADELRAALPAGWVAVNDETNAVLIDKLMATELLDEPDLMLLLLRRADEERITAGAKARSGRRDARALQGLVSHENGEVSAAAMALILARGRRRDRFGQCLITIDDMTVEAAERLIHTIAAGVRSELRSARGAGEADALLATASQDVLDRLEPQRGIDMLTATLVGLLNEHAELTDELLLAAASEGEISFLAHAFARLGKIPAHSVFAELLSSDASRIMGLLRAAAASRELAAGLLAAIGDLLGITDPGEAIARFDQITDEQLGATRAWLSTAVHYRSALEALGEGHG